MSILHHSGATRRGLISVGCALLSLAPLSCEGSQSSNANGSAADNAGTDTGETLNLGGAAGFGRLDAIDPGGANTSLSIGGHAGAGSDAAQGDESVVAMGGAARTSTDSGGQGIGGASVGVGGAAPSIGGPLGSTTGGASSGSSGEVDAGSLSLGGVGTAGNEAVGSGGMPTGGVTAGGGDDGGSTNVSLGDAEASGGAEAGATGTPVGGAGEQGLSGSSNAPAVSAGAGGAGSGGDLGGSVEIGGAPPAVCSEAPLSNAPQHCSSYDSGGIDGYTWKLWSNSVGACITPYGVGAAFKVTWDGIGDMLAMVGIEWDATQSWDQLGKISADFSETKSGTGGDFSFVGIYGLTTEPSCEFYIVEDSFDALPIAVSASVISTIDVDGGTYDMVSKRSPGAGSEWTQIYSIRREPRTSGHISISTHFEAWTDAGLTLGLMQEAMLSVETTGGSGSVDFTCGAFTIE